MRLNFHLPSQPCVLCGSMTLFGAWCEACDAAMPYHDAPHCPICARITPDGEVCGHCMKKPPAFSRTVALFGYDFPADRLIQAMKYNEQLALARMFAEKLSQRLTKSDLPDWVIAMPLHPARLKLRGFNQALLIAEPLARLLDLPLLKHACKRVRDTPSQTSLPFNERTQNMRDAFACNADLSGKHVALVDDVMTTGASLDALAEAIRKCGAAKVSAWVAARTV